MFRIVTIISLLFSVTVHAAPMPPEKCAKILVSEDVEGQVQEMAVRISAVAGNLHLKMQLKDSPDSLLRFEAGNEKVKQFSAKLQEMSDLVAQIRADFYRSAADASKGVDRLKALMGYLPTIEAGIALVAGPNTKSPQQPRKFMKREIFRGDDLLPGGMADWPGDEIQQSLRGTQP